MTEEKMNMIKTLPRSFVSGIKNLPAALSHNRMLLSVIAFFYLFPLVTGAALSPERDLLTVLTQCLIFGLLAISFDLQLGRAGLLNFGHVALFGVGTYFVAFTLNSTIFPELNAIPYLAALVIAMMVGALLGFIMGLTTSRMKGTAFAFIALAISMFLYNYFTENPAISGGETGLRAATPSIMTSAAFYVFFVIITMVVLIGFFGMIVLYIRKRTESISPILFTPVMLSIIVVLWIFGTNFIGVVLVSLALIFMLLLYMMERVMALPDPLQIIGKMKKLPNDTESKDKVTTYVIPLIIVIIAVLGIIVSFWTNINGMVALWFQNSDTFYYRIPVLYYLTLTCIVLTFVFVKRLIASPFGRMLTAVAQNQDRAEALGFNSYRCKIVVLSISGAIAALAGGLYAPYLRSIQPETALGVGITIDAMLYTIIGGIATFFGPILGASVVEYSQINLTGFLQSIGLPSELWLIVLGAIYIVIVLFLPLGIVGSASTKSRSLKERLQRVKVGKFEFGLQEKDYWVFTALGSAILILLMLFITVTI